MACLALLAAQAPAAPIVGCPLLRCWPLVARADQSVVARSKARNLTPPSFR